MQQICICCLHCSNMKIFCPNWCRFYIVLVTFGLSPLVLVCICNANLCAVCLVVDSMFCSGCLVCSLIFAVEMVRWCWTVVAIRPGQLVKWWLLMAVIYVDVDGKIGTDVNTLFNPPLLTCAWCWKWIQKFLNGGVIRSMVSFLQYLAIISLEMLQCLDWVGFEVVLRGMSIFCFFISWSL